METDRSPGLQADFFEDYRGYSPKKISQKEKFFKFLQDGQWHSNYELTQIVLNYKGRIWDLKQQGYLFDKRHDGGSEWSWKLCGRI